MTQAISVYISKAIFRPKIYLDILLNLEQQKCIPIQNKVITTQYLMSVICSTIQQRICSIYIYMYVISRSVRVIDNMQLHFTPLHFNSFHFTGVVTSLVGL